MKKVVKIGSSLMLSLVVLLNCGCSCKLNEKKVIERSGALKETELVYVSNELVDYTTTYKKVSNNGITEEVVEYKVERDVETDTYYLTTRTGNANIGEEIKYNTIEEKLFMKDGKVIYQQGETPVTIPSSYLSTTAAFMYLSTLRQTSNYYKYSTETYEEYKSVPFNACTPEDLAVEEDLPGILPSYIKDSLSCVSKRKLFSRNTTYTVNYRASLQQLTEIVVKTDKKDRITSVEQKNNIVYGENKQAVENITFTVSYNNVKK